QRFLVVDKTCIQMWYGHWWSSDFRFSVYFCMMLLNDFRVVADQEQSAYRESADMLGFWNACFLKQWQASATAADKDEVSVMVFNFIVFKVLHFHFPSAVTAAFNVFYGMFVIDFDLLFFQVVKQHF